MGGTIQLKYLLDTHIWLWSDPGIFNKKPLGVSLCLRAFVAIFEKNKGAYRKSPPPTNLLPTVLLPTNWLISLFIMEKKVNPHSTKSEDLQLQLKTLEYRQASHRHLTHLNKHNRLKLHQSCIGSTN